ncbi:hypothetical protein EGH31_0641 [Haemophilus haemolyticus]|uniref:Uncharacterized protein n=1 Tax=Haemophilus haemolyticus TaxID=726 RepID=A0AAQ1YMP2_HAEHA|nr:hypothetical protein EGH31_0641 [Haemophilus haemolyticus]
MFFLDKIESGYFLICNRDHKKLSAIFPLCDTDHGLFL